MELVLTLCTAFAGTAGGAPVPSVVMGYQINEKVTVRSYVERHEIFGAVFYKLYSKPAGGVVFAPPLYMRNPPMVWAGPNNPLFGPATTPHSFPSFNP